MERASSEDSLPQRREDREAAYLRLYALGEGGSTPSSVAWADLMSFGRALESRKRQELLPNVGVAEGPGVPGWDNSSSISSGVPSITGTSGVSQNLCLTTNRM